MNRQICESKGAKIRNRFNEVPHLTQVTNGKVKNSQLDITVESQEGSPFPAGVNKAHISRSVQLTTLSHSTIKRHQEDKLSKATSSLFPIKMIAILKWKESNVQQSIDQLQTPSMRVIINKSQQQQNHHFRMDSSLSYRAL